VCEALDYAHEKRDAQGAPLGIVHRDVSPQNVLVGFDGAVKLIDFGIAKAETKLSKTQSGVLKGKFSYMSPEQVKGLAVDRRSDVFAAGVLLWELLCGRKLFAGDSDLAVLEKVRSAEVAPPRTLRPDLPEPLERIVLKALAADPAARHQRAIDLHDDLVPFAAGFGPRQLAAWLRAEFAPDHDREQARLARWTEAGSDPDATPPQPSRAGSAFDVSEEVTKAVRAQRREALARPRDDGIDQRIWLGGAALVFAVAAAVALAIVFSR
jgi:serine/threonine protein kinase